jgi:hypothetical protein
VIDFLGLGGQKCGSTWLYRNLSRHPDVWFPAWKEVHFWDKRLHRGVAWWLHMFPQAPAGVVQGEITPAYAILDPDVIRVIHAVVPDVRLFFSMRNPVARAWSAALMVLRRQGRQVEDTSDRWFLTYFRSPEPRRKGTYTRCIQNWLRVFPEDSLHLIVFDDIRLRPRAVLAGLAWHLGVDPAPFVAAPRARLRRPAFKGADVDVRPSLLEPLREMYADEVHRLSGWMARDLSPWLEWDGRRAGSRPPSLASWR